MSKASGFFRVVFTFFRESYLRWLLLFVLVVFLSLVEGMVKVLLVWGGTLLKNGVLTINLLGNVVSEVLVISVKRVQRVFPMLSFERPYML